LKFKLDENLPELVREALRELGHDAHTIAEEGLAGAEDQTVHAACIAEGRVLITLDLHFSDIRACSPGSYPGIPVSRYLGIWVSGSLDIAAAGRDQPAISQP